MFYTYPDGEMQMRCPRCQGDNIHHRAVVVAAPEQEDAERVLVRIQMGKPGDMGGVGFPHITECRMEHEGGMEVPVIWGRHKRRGSIAIVFDCEACGPDCGLLVVEQHKGTSLLNMVAS